MTNEQFTGDFRHHLTVGGPKREAIIAEMASHVAQQSPDQLGDPAQLAKKLNRVHLGLFASFRTLAIVAVATTLFFDVLLPYLGVRSSANGTDSPLLNALWMIVPFISPILFIYGTHVVSRMRYRWIYAGVLAIIFSAGFAIQQELMQATGYLLVASADGSTSVWTIHIQPILDFLGTYAVIGYGVMVVTAGRQLIVSQHPVIDLALAFLIAAAAARFALPMVWNAITTFHYTEAMASWSASAFGYLTAASLGIGLLNAGAEWLRMRTVRKMNTVA